MRVSYIIYLNLVVAAGRVVLHDLRVNIIYASVEVVLFNTYNIISIHILNQKPLV